MRKYKSFRGLYILLLILYNQVLNGTSIDGSIKNGQLQLIVTALDTDEYLKNFHLSKTSFDEMVSQLKQGKNELFKQIFLAQGEETIVYLKTKYKAQHDDAYDAFIESLITFRQRIIEDKVSYGNLRFLLTRMASQHYFKIAGKQFSGPQEGKFDQLLQEDESERYSDEEIKILNKAFQELNEGCRQLLKMNYYDGMRLTEIAEKIGKSAASIRKQKERCKQTLVELFNKSYNG